MPSLEAHRALGQGVWSSARSPEPVAGWGTEDQVANRGVSNVYIDEGRSLDEDKELKVKIPVGHHLRLHSLKVLTGQTISDTVADALSTYFEDKADMSASPSESGQEPAEATADP